MSNLIKTKICIICNKTFEVENLNTKLCSNECKRIHNYNTVKKSLEKHPRILKRAECLKCNFDYEVTTKSKFCKDCTIELSVCEKREILDKEKEIKGTNNRKLNEYIHQLAVRFKKAETIYEKLVIYGWDTKKTEVKKDSIENK